MFGALKFERQLKNTLLFEERHRKHECVPCPIIVRNNVYNKRIPNLCFLDFLFDNSQM